MSETQEFIVYSDQGQSDPFTKLLITNFREIGFDVSRKPNTWRQWRRAKELEQPCAFIGKPAPHQKALCAYRFLSSNNWIIDRASLATQTELGAAEFIPMDDEGKGKKFLSNLKKRFYNEPEYAFALQDFVLVVLDDFLAKVGARDTTAYKMIEDVLKFAPEHQLVIHADLENYSAHQRKRLDDFDLHDAVIFSNTPLDRLIPACAYVVTQDGGVSLQAALHEKPCVLYGDEIFHHISRSKIKDRRLKKSFNRMGRDRPNYAGYLKWVMDHTIDATAPDAASKLVARLQDLNWPD